MSILTRLLDWFRPVAKIPDKRHIPGELDGGYGAGITRQGGATASDIDDQIARAARSLEAKRAGADFGEARREYERAEAERRAAARRRAARAVARLRASQKRARAKQDDRRLKAVEGGRR